LASVQSSCLLEHRTNRPSFQTPVSSGGYLPSSCSTLLRLVSKLSLNTYTLDHVIPCCLEGSWRVRPRTPAAYEPVCGCIPALEECRLWRSAYCRTCQGMFTLEILRHYCHICTQKFQSQKKEWTRFGMYVGDAVARVIQYLARTAEPRQDLRRNLDELCM
jgi:hypothetical protein